MLLMTRTVAGHRLPGLSSWPCAGPAAGFPGSASSKWRRTSGPGLSVISRRSRPPADLPGPDRSFGGCGSHSNATWKQNARDFLAATEKFQVVLGNWRADQ